MRADASVINACVLLAKLFREVPHRGEKKRGARLCRPDVRRFIAYFGHEYAILRRVEISKRAGVNVELVAQYKHEVAAGFHQLCEGLLRRHFSLQYFTSGQFFAHALRHVIGFAQTAQLFSGRLDLLPLNAVFILVK